MKSGFTLTINKISQRLINSPAFTILILVLILNMAFFSIPRDGEKNFADDFSRLNVIKKFIENGQKPDIVLVGSSLVLWSSYYPDWKLKLGPNGTDLMTYLESRYFSRQLENRLNKKMTVNNLSYLAATPKDVLLILEGLIDHEKDPKLLIYGIAPRSMADNCTPIAGAIGGKFTLNLEPKHEINIFTQCKTRFLSNRHLKALIRDYTFLGHSPTLEQTVDLLVSKIFKPYAMRAEMKEGLTHSANIALGRKVHTNNTKSTSYTSHAEQDPHSKNNMAVSVAPSKDKHTSPEKLEKDLIQYRARYNPPNFQKFEENLVSLEKLFKLCNRKNIHLILVEMPLTDENKGLIPDSLSCRYHTDLEKLRTKYNISYIDLSQGFLVSDFLDSAHLNGSGGKKFQERLAKSIADLDI